MGCDIHCHVEVKKNGKWRWHQPLVPNRRYDPKEKIDTWNQPKVKEEGYDNRNYRLFAILADVRNGRGFAGIRTGDQFNPISPQRGLPPDVDPKIRERSDGYHSYSWLTLSEILAYDWEQVNEQQGYLSQEQYRAWDKKSMPNGWCGMVSGRDVTTMTEANYLEHQKEGFGGKRPYILCKWVTTYRDAVGCDWWQDTIPRLQKYAKEFDDVRLTFWFDS